MYIYRSYGIDLMNAHNKCSLCSVQFDLVFLSCQGYVGVCCECKPPPSYANQQIGGATVEPGGGQNCLYIRASDRVMLMFSEYKYIFICEGAMFIGGMRCVLFDTK